MQNAGCVLVERFSALALSLSLSLSHTHTHTQVERFRALVQYDKALESVSGEHELPPQRREWLRTQVLSLLLYLLY